MREVSPDLPQLVIETPSKVVELLQEFHDIAPLDLPKGLPPPCNIQHVIDLVSEVTLPNLSHYWLNPIKHAELKWQVDDLLTKGFIRESLSPYVIPAWLKPKKDETWRMCIDFRAINGITVKYRFPILRLDNMLDLVSGSS